MQRLLAIIASMIASMGSGKAAKPSDFAPWLKWDSGETDFANSLEMQALNAIMQQQSDKANTNG